jgi:hypothetical protein
MTTPHETHNTGRALPVNPLATAWTAADLMAAQFPPPKWAVPGIVAEGVTLLAGPPKVGKSWLSLGLGLSIASGMPALGTVPVDDGPVLYLALEDTPRRLQTRMRKMLDGFAAPNSLTLATTCPPLPQGGDIAIAGWLDRNPTARLVVIDVFAKMRGAPPAGLSAYDADYSAVGRVKKLADHYGIAVILVHHVRKASSDDFLQEVSGTNGLAGAADATLVLKRARNQADALLCITGRDVEETEHAMTFEPQTGSWLLLEGPAHEHTLSDTRTTILRHLRQHPGTTPKTLATALGLTHDTAKKTCARMADDGQLTTDGTGRYYAPLTTTTTEPAPGVPGVPPVPEPLFPQADGATAGGHPGRRGVPDVSDHPATEGDNR